MQITVSFATSIVAMFGMLVVFIGFSRIWDDHGNPVMRNMRFGAVACIAAFIVRSGYWDILQPIMGDGWAPMRDLLGGQSFSALFNIMFLVPVYFWLRAKWWLIPEHHRSRWRWWNSWLYPPRRMLHLEVNDE